MKCLHFMPLGFSLIVIPMWKGVVVAYKAVNSIHSNYSDHSNCSAFTKREDQAGGHLYVSFKMENYKLKGDLIPHVYGSVPLIGSWDSSKALSMEREFASMWELSFTVPPNHVQITGKFVSMYKQRQQRTDEVHRATIITYSAGRARTTISRSNFLTFSQTVIVGFLMFTFWGNSAFISVIGTYSFSKRRSFSKLWAMY